MTVECVINVSEGRDDAVLTELAAGAGPALLDLHRDPDHHRAVLTVAGPADVVAAAARTVATIALARLDLRAHEGAHPRLGVLDVVPFVPYEPGGPPPEDLSAAVTLRDEFAAWLGTEMGVPTFLYGPLPGGRTRSLPDLRRRAFGGDGGLPPDYGPARPDTAERRHRGRGPARAGRLQRVGVVGGGGSLGGATGPRGPRARRSACRSDGGPRCRAI